MRHCASIVLPTQSWDNQDIVACRQRWPRPWRLVEPVWRLRGRALAWQVALLPRLVPWPYLQVLCQDVVPLQPCGESPSPRLPALRQPFLFFPCPLFLLLPRLFTVTKVGSSSGFPSSSSYTQAHPSFSCSGCSFCAPLLISFFLVLVLLLFPRWVSLTKTSSNLALDRSHSKPRPILTLVYLCVTLCYWAVLFSILCTDLSWP